MDVSETPEMTKSGVAYPLGRIPAGKGGWGGVLELGDTRPSVSCLPCPGPRPLQVPSELRAGGPRVPPWAHGASSRTPTAGSARHQARCFSSMIILLN